MRIQTAPYFLANPQDISDVSAANVKRLAESKRDHEYNEDWLQDLIHTHPSLLPAQEIEGLYEHLIPVCRELKCDAGSLDNLYVTPDGYLVLAECKLWRNPESRRKVIAQIMDYAKDFASWGYDDLMQAINNTNKTTHENPLYEAVASESDAIDEIAFVDQVSKNMRLGRHLLLIVGDGIQENMVSLSEHVQKNMGLHFTLGLVEIGLFKFENNGLMVIPSVIAKTELLPRAVIRIEPAESNVKIIESVDTLGNKTAKRPITLTEEDFFTNLKKNNPKAYECLNNILPKLESIGVRSEMKTSFILKYSPDGENNFNLGCIYPDGEVRSMTISWKPNDLGHIETAHQFMKDLAALIPNAYLGEHKSPKERSIMVGDRKLNIADFADKEDAYINILQNYLEKLQEIVE